MQLKVISIKSNLIPLLQNVFNKLNVSFSEQILFRCTKRNIIVIKTNIVVWENARM